VEDTVYTAATPTPDFGRCILECPSKRSTVCWVRRRNAGRSTRHLPRRESDGASVPHDTNFRCRVVIFRAGWVVKKHAEFYVD